MNAHFQPLPDAVDAECTVLGAILQSNDLYWRVNGFLKPHHFREAINRQIFEIIVTMMAEKKPVNPLTIKPYLPTEAMHGDLTAYAYVVNLFANSVGGFAADGSARAVVDNWGQVSGIARLEDGIKALRTLPVNATTKQVLVDIQAELTAIANEIGEESTAVTMADAVDKAMQATEDAYKFKKPSGITTGVEAVDQLTGPWEPGQQIIIGGGTKQGKTALAMQCGVGLAAHGPIWVYSGEMSIKQIAMREIARRTGIPVERQKEGRIAQAEWQRLKHVRQEVERLPILIEKRRLTLDQIHDIARTIKRERGLAGMIVDHVGLLAWGRDDARREDYALSAKATQTLKAIYEDLGVPGMSLVQLKKNTFVQTFSKKSIADRMREAIYLRPKYTDLMGAVERDADHVLIPFNPRPILAGLEPEEGSDDHILWEDKMREYEKRAEIILALSREQQFPARRAVEWHGATTSFGPPFVGKQESLLPEGF